MSDLVKKDIKYLNKDFAQFRQNLVNFAKNYFPDTYQDFNESSPGMMFMEMAAYVGDVLSYYTDSSFKESMLSSAEESSNILMLSQLFGYKPRLNTPATCNIDVFQLVPAKGTGTTAVPDMAYALTVAAGMEVSTDDGIVFHTEEPVDFNQDPDITVYEIDGSGNVARYLLKKVVKVISGEIKTATFEFTDPKPYDKIILPENNIIDVISMTDAANNKWYEVDYLAQDTILQDIANIPFNDPDLSQYRSTVPYILKLRKTAKRFVSRVRDDERIELLFGSGVSSDADEEIVPNPRNVGHGLEYLRRTTTSTIDPSNFLYTSTYGIAPSNTTLTVKYSYGGSTAENVSVSSIINVDNVSYLNETGQVDLTTSKASLAVVNNESAVGARQKQNLESIRQNAVATFAAQSRAITREDYIARVYSMPGRYGAVSKAYIIGDSQINTEDKTYPSETIMNPYALNLYILSEDANNNFIEANNALQENLRTYISQYRMLTDAINIKAAFIINLGIEFEVIPKPNNNSNEVVLQCIDRLKTILHNDRLQINGPLDISGIISDLDRLEGVQSIPSFEFINLHEVSKGYAGNEYDISKAIKNNILYPSLDPSIFEIKYPNADIKGKAVKP
tara:strand:- start:12220 stop:14079 length:1860 start_codon:yes stop_codon:yes gene_type:complete